MLDELNIMRKVLKTMDGIVKSASKVVEDVQVETDDGRSEESEPEGPPEEAQSNDGALRLDSDNSDDEEAEVDESSAPETQGARRVWAHRGDPDEYSYPPAMVMTSLEEICAMVERAEKTERAVCFTPFFCFPPFLSLPFLSLLLWTHGKHYQQILQS